MRGDWRRRGATWRVHRSRVAHMATPWRVGLGEGAAHGRARDERAGELREGARLGAGAWISVGEFSMCRVAGERDGGVEVAKECQSRRTW